jgi:hypothetical protein
LSADREVGYLAANYTQLAAPEMLEQLVAVQMTRDQVALSLLASRREQSAACVQLYKADVLMQSALQYYHDQGDPAWLKKAKMQTLVTMRLLSLCATTEA